MKTEYVPGEFVFDGSRVNTTIDIWITIFGIKVFKYDIKAAKLNPLTRKWHYKDEGGWPIAFDDTGQSILRNLYINSTQKQLAHDLAEIRGRTDILLGNATAIVRKWSFTRQLDETVSQVNEAHDLVKLQDEYTHSYPVKMLMFRTN